MRILAALDDPDLQGAVAGALEPEGHELLATRDGVEALALFRAREPDLVILVRDLPGMDGLELARLVRLVSRRRFVPILMFTSGHDADFYRKGLEAGVLEFIHRSFDPGELKCRVETITRLVRIQGNMLAARSIHDQEVSAVKHLLKHVVATSPHRDTPGIHMETLPTQRVNGDACVHRESIPGVHFGMICDAAGHGLMAGISTIPVLETFLGMVGRDIPLATIYKEIHAKLKQLLPTGRFTCLLLLRMDVARGILSILNAGMPEVHLLSPSGGLQSFPSRTLPAGISGVDPGIVVAEAAIAGGDRILAYSDGFGELATREELLRLYLVEPSTLPHPAHCQAIRKLVSANAPQEDRGDDVTWALWEVPGQAVPMRQPGAPLPGEKLAPGMTVAFQLDPKAHAPRELVPHVLSLLLDLQVSHAQTQLFGMLLTEALTNAVDHGLLGLDSRIKAEGFEAYEQHRQRALAGLSSGGVSFRITLFHAGGPPPRAIRSLRTEVEDTGQGFDWKAWTQLQDTDPARPFGRGIALLLGLATEVEFNDSGNRIAFTLDCP